MIVTLDLTDREVEILAELRRTAYLTSDADVFRVAVYRLAREFDIGGLHPSDFAVGTRARKLKSSTWNSEP